MSKLTRQLNTDCEGPTCLNDNALELVEYFISSKDDFFLRLSRYDDYLADVAKKPDYEAGYTLALIIPFLKAYGATNKLVEEFCQKHVDLMPGAKEFFTRIKTKLPIFIISTSYQQFAHSLAKEVDVPKENVYCTFLDIDSIDLPAHEIHRLKELKVEITSLPLIDLPPSATRFEELSAPTKKAIKRLDYIFWTEIINMKAGRFLKQVRPVGGREKVKAMLDSLKLTGNSLSDVIFIGDSITDAPALKKVKEHGGLAVAFNANRYAIEASDIACVTDSTLVSTLLVELFCLYSKDEMLSIVKNWDMQTLLASGLDKELVKKVFADTQPKVVIITEANIDQITWESTEFRKALRGASIGMLA